MTGRIELGDTVQVHLVAPIYYGTVIGINGLPGDPASQTYRVRVNGLGERTYRASVVYLISKAPIQEAKPVTFQVGEYVFGKIVGGEVYGRIMAIYTPPNEPYRAVVHIHATGHVDTFKIAAHNVSRTSLKLAAKRAKEAEKAALPIPTPFHRGKRALSL